MSEAATTEIIETTDAPAAPQRMRCSIQGGALAEAPVWDNNVRSKNWLARIWPSPANPGGLGRAFCPHARGDYFYVVSGHLALGDAVEFAADYVTSGAKVHRKRWYGVVVEMTADALVLEECETPTEAFALARPYIAEAARLRQLAQEERQRQFAAEMKQFAKDRERKKQERLAAKKPRDPQAPAPPREAPCSPGRQARSLGTRSRVGSP